MGRYYCNGKKGYCDRFVGNVKNVVNIDCKNCKYADGTGGEYKEIVTNYDRIKSMSVEEMAGFIDKNFKCRKCAYYHKCCNGDCANGIIQWLLQEVSENDR